jgi:hypothetical protein
MPHQVERRDFLASMAGAAAAFASSSLWTAKSYANIVGANDRIRVGQFRVGGMGPNHSDCLRDLSTPNNLEVVSAADCWLIPGRVSGISTTRNGRTLVAG